MRIKCNFLAMTADGDVVLIAACLFVTLLFLVQPGDAAK
jgi:hypothetical protein